MVCMPCLLPAAGCWLVLVVLRRCAALPQVYFNVNNTGCASLAGDCLPKVLSTITLCETTINPCTIYFEAGLSLFSLFSLSLSLSLCVCVCVCACVSQPVNPGCVEIGTYYLHPAQFGTALSVFGQECFSKNNITHTRSLTQHTHTYLCTYPPSHASLPSALCVDIVDFGVFSVSRQSWWFHDYSQRYCHIPIMAGHQR
jgi:hypothetical protein